MPGNIAYPFSDAAIDVLHDIKKLGIESYADPRSEGRQTDEQHGVADDAAPSGA